MGVNLLVHRVFASRSLSKPMRKEEMLTEWPIRGLVWEAIEVHGEDDAGAIGVGGARDGATDAGGVLVLKNRLVGHARSVALDNRSITELARDFLGDGRSSTSEEGDESYSTHGENEMRKREWDDVGCCRVWTSSRSKSGTRQGVSLVPGPRRKRNREQRIKHNPRVVRRRGEEKAS